LLEPDPDFEGFGVCAQKSLLQAGELVQLVLTNSTGVTVVPIESINPNVDGPCVQIVSASGSALDRKELVRMLSGRVKTYPKQKKIKNFS